MVPRALVPNEGSGAFLYGRDKMELSKKDVKIFITAGKANSGKDTTCELIDNYFKLKGKKIVNLQFSSYIKMYAKTLSGWNGDEDTKPRSLLQELGTEIIRKKIDNDFFIKRIIGDIEVYSYYCDAITISDARLPEELDSIKKSFKNVYKIKIERPNYENNLNDTERKHITETALDNYDDYDYVLVNDGSIEELNEKVIKIIDEVI